MVCGCKLKRVGEGVLCPYPHALRSCKLESACKDDCEIYVSVNVVWIYEKNFSILRKTLQKKMICKELGLLKKRTLSQQRVLELIQREEKFDLNDMGFVLTVIRDSCLDEDTVFYLEVLLGELWERRNN